MKLRLVASSIRLRVTRAELARLASGEEVLEDELGLDNGMTLSWSLRVDDCAAAMIELIQSELGSLVRVRFPASHAQDWLEGESVSLRAEIPAAGSARATRLLIEKDFQCLIPRDSEDQGDHFPNPAATGAVASTRAEQE